MRLKAQVVITVFREDNYSILEISNKSRKITIYSEPNESALDQFIKVEQISDHDCEMSEGTVTNLHELMLWLSEAGEAKDEDSK